MVDIRIQVEIPRERGGRPAATYDGLVIEEILAPRTMGSNGICACTAYIFKDTEGKVHIIRPEWITKILS